MIAIGKQEVCEITAIENTHNNIKINNHLEKWNNDQQRILMHMDLDILHRLAHSYCIRHV